jgi:hypothetical protein
MQVHFKHLRSKSFPMIYGIQSNGFWPLQLFFEDLRVHLNSNSQSESSLGSVEVHSLTLSHTPRSMKCDFWASLLAHTFLSPCLGCEPKATIVIGKLNKFNHNLDKGHVQFKIELF